MDKEAEMTQEILDKFRMGYFILYKNTGGIFGDTIVKKQLSAGFMPDDAQFCHIEVSGGEIHSVDISPPVSKLVKITEEHKGEYCRVVRFKNEEYEKALRYKVAYFSATLCNKGYDIKGVLSFIFRWIKQSNRFYFCSEGALWALQMVFPKALQMAPDRCMPAHFTMQQYFEVVYEGVIE